LDSDLVHEPRGEVLLVDLGAHEQDPFVAGDCGNRAVDL
jgi:hypothetical protein